MKIEYFTENEIGRDFVVGDIHGCYDELMCVLDHLKFDYSKDRLFSVGDITDRGTDNVKSMELIDQPWFHMVLGNHEDMIMNEYYFAALQNGTAWAAAISDGHYGEELKNKLHDYRIKLVKLPFGINIETMAGNYFITHAELPRIIYSPNSDNKLDFNLLEEYECEDRMGEGENVIWGRKMFTVNTIIKNAKWVFHGHSIFRDPVIAGNRLHLDLGFYLGQYRDIGKLALFEIGTEILHEVHVKFSPVPKVVNHKTSIPEYNTENKQWLQ